MTSILLLALALLLIAACGAFVAAEFSLLAVDRGDAQREADLGDTRSAGVVTALTSLSTQLSGAQLGITVTNLAIGFLAEPAIARLVEGPLESVGLDGAAARGVSIAIALVLSTALTMVFGELVPKNLAIALPLATAKAVQGPIRGFSSVMRVPIRAFNGVANAVLARFGLEAQEELASGRSAEELVALVRRSAQEGTLESGTAVLLQRSLVFGDKRAADVLVPRVRMRTLDTGAPVSRVLDLVRATGHSRFPVTGAAGLDDVVGVVHLRHLVAVPREWREGTSVGEVMAPATLVPSSLHLGPLLDQLQDDGLQMAVVIDEFGGTEGLVTLEDVVEELVGDVADEHDRGAAFTRRRGGGGWSVSGLLRPDEVQAATGVPVPVGDDYETLGGLLGELLGRIPREGDRVDSGGVRYTVERTDGLRVDVVHLRALGEDEADRAEAADARPDSRSGGGAR